MHGDRDFMLLHDTEKPTPIHPRHEEPPINISYKNTPPPPLGNAEAGLLLAVTVTLISIAFTLSSLQDALFDKRGLQQALAKERSKAMDVNGLPVPPVKILKTKPFKYQDRIMTDWPPVVIPDFWVRKVHELP